MLTSVEWSSTRLTPPSPPPTGPRARRPSVHERTYPIIIAKEEGKEFIMRLSYPAGLAVLALTAALALAPSAARAGCRDFNNNGSVNIADVQILGQCVSNCVLNPPCDVADCPAVAPGPLCGTGTLAGCADIFKENPGPGTDTVHK